MRSGQAELQTSTRLLRRLRADHPCNAAWEEFLEKYGRFARRIVLSAGVNPADAEDVVQETYLSILKSLPQFSYNPQVCTFRTWLFGIIKRRIADHFRKMSKKAQAFQAGVASESLFSAVDEAFQNHWNREWEQTLAQMAEERTKKHFNPEHFQIFDAAFKQGLSASQIAESLGVTRATIYLVKHRVQKRMAKEVQALRRELG